MYGPPVGQTMCIFVDDLNMPMQKYGAQPPIELLRQLLDQGYWFNRWDTSNQSVLFLFFAIASDIV